MGKYARLLQLHHRRQPGSAGVDRRRRLWEGHTRSPSCHAGAQLATGSGCHYQVSQGNLPEDIKSNRSGYNISTSQPIYVPLLRLLILRGFRHSSLLGSVQVGIFTHIVWLRRFVLVFVFLQRKTHHIIHAPMTERVMAASPLVLYFLINFSLHFLAVYSSWD